MATDAETIENLKAENDNLREQVVHLLRGIQDVKRCATEGTPPWEIAVLVLDEFNLFYKD